MPNIPKHEWLHKMYIAIQKKLMKENRKPTRKEMEIIRRYTEWKKSFSEKNPTLPRPRETTKPKLPYPSGQHNKDTLKKARVIASARRSLKDIHQRLPGPVSPKPRMPELADKLDIDPRRTKIESGRKAGMSKEEMYERMQPKSSVASPKVMPKLKR